MTTTSEIYSNLFAKSYKIEVVKPPSFNKDPGRVFPVLFSNDGQDFEKVGVAKIIRKLQDENVIPEMVVIGVHAGERKQEYGVAAEADYLKRGAMAETYSRFFVDELLPWAENEWKISKEPALRSIMGFSLGGLSALDISWRHPHLFGKVGVFSGSFWWRKKGLDEGYKPTDRIMHAQIAKSKKPNLKIWLQSGGKDETNDRDQDGLIDSIGDTLDVIIALQKLGYKLGNDLRYLDLPNASHDMKAWAQALPDFLQFTFGINGNIRP